MHRHHPDWSSHIPVLIKALGITDGPVLELGMGISSTPLLHMLCFDQGRLLVSYEHDQQYANIFKKFDRGHHKIRVVNDWNELDTSEYHWSIVFVDHKPEERRKVEIQSLQEAELLVIHDSEPSNNHLYEYDTIYPLFKYRFDYNKARTHTTVLSNTRDLIEFYEK